MDSSRSRSPAIAFSFVSVAALSIASSTLAIGCAADDAELVDEAQEEVTTGVGSPCDVPAGATWANIDACMTNMVHASEMPGAAVRLERPDGTALPGAPAGTAIYGTFKNRAGATVSDPIFAAGSLTKPLVAATVLQVLRETGYDLNTRLVDIQGWSQYGVTSATNADGDIKQQMRVFHLLSHTAGFPQFSRHQDVGGPAQDGEEAEVWAHPFQNFVAGLPAMPSSCKTGSRQWMGSPGLYDECVYRFSANTWVHARTTGVWEMGDFYMRLPVVRDWNAASQSWVRRQPGAAFTYSNMGYIIAARIAEGLTGKSINVLVREKILNKAGMSDSFMVPYPVHPATNEWGPQGQIDAARAARVVPMTFLEGAIPEHAAPYDANLAATDWDEFRRGWTFQWPEGGLYSTPRDLLRFLRMLRSGGWIDGVPVVDASVATAMLSEFAHGHTPGFGYIRGSNAEGPGAVAHLGRFMAYFWSDPRGVNGVFMSNRLPQHVCRSYPQLAECAPVSSWGAVRGTKEIQRFVALSSQLVEPVITNGLRLNLDAAKGVYDGAVSPYSLTVPSSASDPKFYMSGAPSCPAADVQGLVFNPGVNTSVVDLDFSVFHDVGPLRKLGSFEGMSGATCGVFATPWQGDGSPASPYRVSLNPTSQTNQHVRVMDDFDPANYSIEVWVRPDVVQNENVFVRSSAAGPMAEWSHQIRVRSDGKYEFYQWASTSFPMAVQSSTAAAAGAWQHVVATYQVGNPGSMKLYVNGVLEGSYSGNAPQGWLGGDRYLVGAQSNGFQALRGSVARAAVYTRALTQAEVKQSCAARRPRFAGAWCAP